MSRARMVVAYLQVETPAQKAFRHAAIGSTVDEILAEPRRVPVLDYDEGRDQEGHPTYWCAADKPPPCTDGDVFFRIAPVWRTTKVAEDAECVACGIEIRRLQEMFS